MSNQYLLISDDDDDHDDDDIDDDDDDLGTGRACGTWWCRCWRV